MGGIEEELIKKTLEAFPREKWFLIKKAIESEARASAEKIALEVDSRDYARTSVFENEVKRLRRIAYYALRRYSGEASIEPLAERGAGIFDFINKISRIAYESKTRVLVEYGCGLFPLTIRSWLFKPRIYIAVDINDDVIEKLLESKNLIEKESNVKLVVVKSDITVDGSLKPVLNAGYESVDLALYNRILHSIARLRGYDLITELIEKTPSNTIVATEPKVSLVKKIDVSARERRFLAKTARILEKKGVVSYHKMIDSETDVIIVFYR